MNVACGGLEEWRFAGSGGVTESHRETGSVGVADSGEVRDPQAAEVELRAAGVTSGSEPAPRSADSRLAERVRQKEAVARLGLLALSGEDLSQLFEEACRLVADTLAVRYCKVLELMRDGDRLLLRAGVGWDAGYVGSATVGTHLESQAGYTLISSVPVIVEDLRQEIRFKGAPLLHDHGVTSGVTATIHAANGSFGVLGAHTRERRVFAEHEVLFIEDVADLLGAAVERQRERDRSLESLTEQSERAEAAERRFEFLAGANALLSVSSIDHATALRNTVRLAVPALADWCFVDFVEPGGDLRRAAVGYAGRPSEPPRIAGELKRRYPLDPNAPHGTPRVLRTGRSELIGEVDDALLQSVATDPEHLALLRRLAPRSYMCVPLRPHRGWSGAIGLVSSESNRRYGAEDLVLAEGLAHCAALALDNAASHVPEVEMAREIVRLSGATGVEAAVVGAPAGNAQSLTRRQLEVLGLMAEGKPARHIANRLHISEDTVRNHIRAIKQALDAGSQLEAIAQARRLGVLPR